ncbi:CASP-like protein 1U4 [Panicum miliaceum]|uniref:CASP-like protein 1U4 n=1 Tax=Panicum miliaceum TaxID=4540 RepID=A0A3L6Q5A7_PANMI|nr:CASP-like protein 1U4 [Panicum miliaceum]
MCDEKKSGGGGKWRHPVSLVFRIAGMGLAVASAAVGERVHGGLRRLLRRAAGAHGDLPRLPGLRVPRGGGLHRRGAGGGGHLPRRVRQQEGRGQEGRRRARAADRRRGAGAAPGDRRLSVCASSVGARFCARVHVSMWLSLSAAVAVSIAEWARGCRGGGGGGEGSDSDDSVCGHGCHSKH